MSRDGQKVGEVHDIVFEPETGRVRALIVRQGFLFTHDVELAGETIESVGDGVVYLRVRAEELGAR